MCALRLTLNCTTEWWPGISGVKRVVFFAYIEDEVAELDYHESDDGSWVPSSDYDTLRTANQRLEGENKRLREIVARSAEACGAYIDNACSLEFMELLPSEIKAKCAALRGKGGE